MGSTKDKVTGAANEAAGKAKQAAGKAIGNKEMQANIITNHLLTFFLVHMNLDSSGCEMAMYLV